MDAFKTLTAAAGQQTDQVLIDSIRLIDATLAKIDAVSDEARAQRMVRAAMYEALEVRYPHVIAVLDEWATAPDGSDTRTYSDVILGAVEGVAA